MEQKNRKELERLLNLYFEGESSLEEEILIKKLLSDEGVKNGGFEYARAMFDFFDQASMERPTSKTYPLVRKRGLTRKLILRISSAAAILIIGFGLGISYINDGTSGQAFCYVNGVPVYDYQSAKNYAESTMALVGESLSKPVEHTEDVKKKMGTTFDLLSNFITVEDN